MQEVHIRGGDDTYVGLLDFRGADLDEFATLEHPEQLGLGGERKLTDFIEEKGSSVIFLEITLSGFDRSGERTFLVAEEFGVDGPLRNRAAVQREIFRIPSCAVSVDDVRNTLFTDSVFSCDKDCKVCRSDGDGHLQSPVQSGVIAYYVKLVLYFLQLLSVHIE